jgi:hypothetical protein
MAHKKLRRAAFGTMANLARQKPASGIAPATVLAFIIVLAGIIWFFHS